MGSPAGLCWDPGYEDRQSETGQHPESDHMFSVKVSGTGARVGSCAGARRPEAAGEGGWRRGLGAPLQPGPPAPSTSLCRPFTQRTGGDEEPRPVSEGEGERTGAHWQREHEPAQPWLGNPASSATEKNIYTFSKHFLGCEPCETCARSSEHTDRHTEGCLL